MRRADTTFVNLRATLDDLQPLVDESKPVAKKLRPFLAQLRPLARDARPTLRDLARLLRSPGSANDLVELTQSAVPLRDAAVGPSRAAPNPKGLVGRQRAGALPGSTKALQQSAPELATARPYAPDLTGWFDDFSHSGLYDALGGASRASVHLNLFAPVNGVLKPLTDPVLQSEAFKDAASLDQRWRCPGAVERGAVYKPTPDFPCDASETPLGP
jgi:phospholipid/cholesterol/gamma-HCH transport system substrate-binding protein